MIRGEQSNHGLPGFDSEPPDFRAASESSSRAANSPAVIRSRCASSRSTSGAGRRRCAGGSSPGAKREPRTPGTRIQARRFAGTDRSRTLCQLSPDSGPVVLAIGSQASSPDRGPGVLARLGATSVGRPSLFRVPLPPHSKAEGPVAGRRQDSTGVETRFINGLDPASHPSSEPRGRRT